MPTLGAFPGIAGVRFAAASQSASRIWVSLFDKDGDRETERLEMQPPGGMCHFKVKLTDAAQVDDELVAWIKQAYETAG